MITVATLDTSPDPPRRFAVDGHVHFHRRGRVAGTLDAARSNFQSVTGNSHGILGALLLAQSSREQVFEQIESMGSVETWCIRPAAHEPESLIAQKDGVEIAIVCGRQVQASEGLEVLALGTRRRIPDGLELYEAIRRVQELGALPVLPWGFGKWLGRRREVIRSILLNSDARRIFIGDNGGRLDVAAPKAISRCERQGFRVLPGTDPFPFGSDFKRTGAFGFLTDSPVSVEAPWSLLREWLLSRPTSPEPYGRACGAARFVFNQLGIQIHKRYFRHAST